jgi:hypothetical protein
MLCQLVCTDRRYQRMNCFNIRELQSILKRKFFTDLFNSHDHRELLGKSMIGLRYTMNNQLNINHDLLSFYQFGTYTEAQNRSAIFTNFYGTTWKNTGINTSSFIFIEYFTSLLNEFNLKTYLYNLMYNLFYTYKLFLFECFNFLTFNKSLDFFFYTYTFSYAQYSLNFFYILGNITNPYFFNIKYFFQNVSLSPKSSTSLNPASLGTEVNYHSDIASPMPTSLNMMYQYSEHSLLGSGRITRYSLPLVSYDYKCGNYLGI